MTRPTNPPPRLLIASPHRYPDLARIWHRSVMRELVPAFAKLPQKPEVEVNIFCDANAAAFRPERLPRVWFSHSGPEIRDFMEFYDATLKHDFEFILFMDSDTFFLDGEWAAAQFKSLRDDPRAAAISFVPRKGGPAIFALLCRVESYRALSEPVFACRYEFPNIWPRGVNLQPGDFAARELARRGQRIINIGAEESWKHIANFRGTTGIRASREQISRAVGESVFLKMLANDRGLLVAAYDNALLGCLYDRLFNEPFAPDQQGTPLGGSLTWPELTAAVAAIRDEKLLAELRDRFSLSRQNVLRLAAREGVALNPPTLLSAA